MDALAEAEFPRELHIQNQFVVPADILQLNAFDDDQENMLIRQLTFDGISILTNSLEVLRPVEPVNLRKHLSIVAKDGTRYKGFDALRGKSCLEIDICSINNFKISLLYVLAVSLPPQYVSHKEFAVFVSERIEDAVFNIAFKPGKKFCPSISGVSVVHPCDWNEFQIELRRILLQLYVEYSNIVYKKLKKAGIQDMNNIWQKKYSSPRRLNGMSHQDFPEFGYQPFTIIENEQPDWTPEDFEGSLLYYVQRLGHDVPIPTCYNVLIDGYDGSVLGSIQKFIEAGRQFNSFCFKMLDIVNTKFLQNDNEKDKIVFACFHIAEDIYSQDGTYHMMWVPTNIERCLNRKCDIYKVLAIPGVGNIRCDNLGIKEEACKVLTMYARNGHEFHRSEAGAFSKSMIITKLLVQNWSAQNFPVRKQFPECSLYKNLCDNTIQRQVEDWCEDSGYSGTCARLEIVMQGDTSVLDGVHSPWIFRSFLLAISAFEHFLSSTKLNRPSNLIGIPKRFLSSWLEGVCQPCVCAINSTVGQLACNRKDMADLFHATSVAEAIIGFLITGKLLKRFPQILLTDLGFNQLSNCLGTKWGLTNVSVEVDSKSDSNVLAAKNIPADWIQKWMCEWSIGCLRSHFPVYNSLEIKYAAFRSLSASVANKSKGAKLYYNRVKSVFEALMFIMLKETIQYSTQYTFVNENFTLSAAETIISNSVIGDGLVLCLSNIITTGELWNSILIGESVRVMPHGLAVLAKSFDYSVEFEKDLITPGNRVSTEECFTNVIANKILADNSLFYCITNENNINAVVPDLLYIRENKTVYLNFVIKLICDIVLVKSRIKNSIWARRFCCFEKLLLTKSQQEQFFKVLKKCVKKAMKFAYDSLCNNAHTSVEFSGFFSDLLDAIEAIVKCSNGVHMQSREIQAHVIQANEAKNLVKKTLSVLDASSVNELTEFLLTERFVF